MPEKPEFTARTERVEPAATRRNIVSLSGMSKMTGAWPWARDILLMVVMALSIGLMFNHFNPSGLNLASLSSQDFEYIDAEWVNLGLTSDQLKIVDARPLSDYANRHIPDSIPMSSDMFSLLYALHKDQLDAPRIVVYGVNPSNPYDLRVAQHLALMGHNEVVLLNNGLKGWMDMGFPTERSP